MQNVRWKAFSPTHIHSTVYITPISMLKFGSVRDTIPFLYSTELDLHVLSISPKTWRLIQLIASYDMHPVLLQRTSELKRFRCGIFFTYVLRFFTPISPTDISNISFNSVLRWMHFWVCLKTRLTMCIDDHALIRIIFRQAGTIFRVFPFFSSALGFAGKTLLLSLFFACTCTSPRSFAHSSLMLPLSLFTFIQLFLSFQPLFVTPTCFGAFSRAFCCC